MSEREKLQSALSCYIKETLTDINIVHGFSKTFSTWTKARESELSRIREITDRGGQIDPNFSRVINSTSKGEAFEQYLKSTVKTASTRRTELEEELSAVLKETLGGLKELDLFLEAVEKLSVTSIQVFLEENWLLDLPEGISREDVQLFIVAARLVCPLVLQFKRDASVFFSAKLQNVDMLECQLRKYTKTAKIICDMMEESRSLLTAEAREYLDVILSGVSYLKSQLIAFRSAKTQVVPDVDLSDDEAQKHLLHIYWLKEIRMDQDFRVVSLFQGASCSGFIKEFSERKSAMERFLDELEGSAVQLENVNRGAMISSVVGNSVGLTGGVAALAGVLLAPVTAGASLLLTVAGVGMGIGGGVTSAAATGVKVGVNHREKGKVNECFQSFMKDVEIIQKCLDVSDQTLPKIDKSRADITVGVGKELVKASEGGGYTESVVDGATALVTADAAAPILEVGLTIAGFMAANALFIGLDMFLLWKNGFSLAKGKETHMSRSIRGRAAVWRLEMDSWQKLYDSLDRGLKTFETNKAIIEKSFCPEREISRNRERPGNRLMNWLKGN